MQYEGNILRHELKYYINDNVYYTLRDRLQTVIGKDKNMKNEEGYLVTSIYFDDMYHNAVYHKINGYRFRKKFRIRSYDRTDKLIRLECKSKFDEYISKTSASLTREEYDLILNQDYDFLLKRPEKVCRELGAYYRLNRLKPVVVVEYTREAYVNRIGNVRITFDKKIAASSGELDIFDPYFCTAGILPEHVMVMEVKFDEFLPEYIRMLLATAMTEKCAISKYVMCRENKRRINYI